MNIVSKGKLRKYLEAHYGVENALVRWYYIIKKAKWKSWKNLQTDFPSADKVGDRVIFNIKGNNCWLIVIVRFFKRHIYIRWFGTQAEYDKLTKKDILNI